MEKYEKKNDDKKNDDCNEDMKDGLQILILLENL